MARVGGIEQSDKMKKIVWLLTLVAYLWLPITSVNAETISLTVSGNGDGSQSQINFQNESTQEVSQSNQTEIENQIDDQANTGGNNVSDNTTESVQVETGDIQSQQTVINQANQNQLAIEDCCQEAELSISNNGSDSQNSIDIISSHSSQTNQQNIAQITTNINISANTGNNKISSNTANQIALLTGNINHHTSVDNGHINQNSHTVSGGSTGSINAKINNNGSGSQNQLAYAYHIDTITNTVNVTQINNSVKTDLNTGGNVLDGNTASPITLVTGSIESVIDLNNFAIGGTYASIDLCCDTDDSQNPDDPDDPGDLNDPFHPSDDSGTGGSGNTSNNGGSGSSSDGSSSDDDSGRGGQVLGLTLPDTGSNLFSLLWINLVLLLIGIYLRFFYSKLPSRQTQLSIVFKA